VVILTSTGKFLEYVWLQVHRNSGTGASMIGGENPTAG